MKIEIWHNLLWSRYKAIVFSNLYRSTESLGHDLRIFQIAETSRNRTGLSSVDRSAHDYPYELIFDGPIDARGSLTVIAALLSRTFRSKADVVALAGYDKIGYFLQALVYRLRGCRVAVFCDSTIFDNEQVRWKALAKRAFFALCSGALCYGTRSRDYMIAYGVAPDRAFDGCQAAALPPDYDVAQVRARRAEQVLQGSAAQFLFVGRLSPEKRVGTLLRAFAEVVRSDADARLRIVGDGQQRAELVALSADLGLTGKVAFSGALSGPALWDAYLSATCLVLPSYREPWGLVVNEALAFGCPVVVSHRCGCIPELVENEKAGLTFTCDDVADLTAKLNRMAAEYPVSPAVVEACLAQIAPYTAERAADNILAGLLTIGADRAKNLRTDPVRTI